MPTPEPPLRKTKDDFRPWKRPVLPHEREADPAIRNAGLGATAGLEFAMVVALCSLGGWWLDGKLGSEPWILVVGTMLGFGGALTLLLRRAARSRGSSPRDGQPPEDPGSSTP